MHILRHMTWVLDGVSQHLDVEELHLPEIKDKVEDVYLAGQQIEVELGMEKMVPKAKVITLNPIMLAKLGLAPGRRLISTFRGHVVDEISGTDSTHIVNMKHRVSAEYEPWKGGEKSGVTYSLTSLIYFKWTIDDMTAYEVDPVNVVRVVNGVDQMRSAREALGIGF